MARQSIFLEKRDDVKAWLIRESKQRQAARDDMHLTALVRKARDRWPELLPPAVYSKTKVTKTGKPERISGQSDASVTQALYRILSENRIWYGYLNRDTKSQKDSKAK